MTIRLTAELRRSFFEIRNLSQALHRDTDFAVSEMVRLVLGYNQGEISLEEAGFWIKVAIRSFMAEVDGLGYALRQAVLRSSREQGLSLSTKEHARLSEKYYDAATDSIVQERAALLSTEEGIKVGFRYFPQLFGSIYALNTSGDEWRGFKRLVRARNNFTHPKVPEHLSPVNALPALQPTLLWFYEQLALLFADIGSRLNVTTASDHSIDTLPKFREVDAPWREFFSEDDHRIIQESGSRTLEYISLIFRLLGDDTKKAMDLCRGSFDSLKALKGHQAQFAFRTYLRTLFSDIEGQIFAARFQLQAAAVRGTVELTSEEVESLGRGETEDRFASALTLWAREFGNGSVAPRHGTSWEALRAARELRNKITHPKKVDDLEIKLKHTDTILAAHGYVIDNMDAFLLDLDKWAVKGGSVLEAIEQDEQAESEDDLDEMESRESV